MATEDDLEYNLFYYQVKVEYRRRYLEAVANRWLICIPVAKALRGIRVTDNFVGDHILKPVEFSESLYCSTADDGVNIYQIDKNVIKAVESNTYHCANILAEQIAYNDEFKSYKILVIDSSLLTKCEEEEVDLKEMILPVTSLKQSKELIERLNVQIECNLNGDNMRDIEEARIRVNEAVLSTWQIALKSQPRHCQCDSKFQHTLTVAIENCIMSQVHDHVFKLLCIECEESDKAIVRKLAQLASFKTTPDQLGVPEGYAIQLPAAVVELAALDSNVCPIDKLMCLQTTIDMIIAQLKTMLVDVYSHLSSDCNVNMSDMVMSNLRPLLLSVIIQAKPLHMAANLAYIEKYQWSLQPNDEASFSLTLFIKAVEDLLNLEFCNLKSQSKKVHTELGIGELIEITSRVDEMFHRSGIHLNFVTPVDRQMELVTSMIEASTQEQNTYDRLENTADSEKRGFVTTLQENLRPCFGLSVKE